MNLLLQFLIQIVIHIGYNNGANILLLSPLGSKSHFNAYMGMFKRLAEVGHQLTVVSAYGTSKQERNITHVILPPEFAAPSFIRHVFIGGPSSPIINILLHSPKVCTASLRTDVVQELKKEQFDIILLTVYMSDCYFSLVHHFKVPFIYLSPSGIVGPLGDLMGNPSFPSISGSVMSPAKFPFGFYSRMKAVLLDLALSSMLKYYTGPKAESICRSFGNCPADMPSFKEMRANASLVMAYSVKLLHTNPVPDMPHVIYGGGAHCRQAKPLPQDLEQWVQDSGQHGFIYFSLGSVITASDMPESSRKTFLKVFAKLKQRILWKYDRDMDDLPSNVKLQKWLPQQDILAHPKLQLFIFQGGILSIMEATYHNVKLLGMPVFGDQFLNLHEGLTEGWADRLYWEDLTEEALEKKIHDLLNNKEMDKVVAKRAKIMNDLPRPPRDEIVFWVEYVLRHNGAAHLKSPVHHLPWYILYNADVWATIFVMWIGSLILSFFALRSIFRRCFRKSRIANKKKKKQ